MKGKLGHTYPVLTVTFGTRQLPLLSATANGRVDIDLFSTRLPLVTCQVSASSSKNTGK